MEQFRRSPMGGAGRIGDTSQKGNWSCFRNEYLNSSTPFSLNSKTTSADIPHRGILEFDFTSSQRPEHLPGYCQAFQAKRLFAVLEKCRLMNYSDRAEALRYLHKCREDCNRIVKVRNIKYDYYHHFIAVDLLSLLLSLVLS